MLMTLTKDSLSEKLHSRLGMSLKEARDVIEVLLEELKMKLEVGEEVKISNFGKWTVREKQPRPGRNPHTGERIEISKRRIVTFHPSDKLRERLNSDRSDD